MNVKNVTILHPLKPMLNLMLVRNHINVSSMGKLHPLWHMWELTLLRNCRSINQCGKFFRSSSSCHTPKVHTLGRNCMNAVTAQKPSPGAVTRLERNYLCSDCSSIPWYTWEPILMRCSTSADCGKTFNRNSNLTATEGFLQGRDVLQMTVGNFSSHSGHRNMWELTVKRSPRNGAFGKALLISHVSIFSLGKTSAGISPLQKEIQSGREKTL